MHSSAKPLPAVVMPSRGPAWLGAEPNPNHFGWEVLVGGILLFTGSLRFVEWKLIGTLFAADAVLLALFPVLVVLRGHKLRKRLPSIFIALGSAWLLSQVVTDLVRQSPFEDYSRGWSKIALTVAHFCALYLLIQGRPKRILAYAWGIAIGGILRFYIAPTAYAASDWWKFGVGFEITLAVVLVTCSFGRRRFLAALILAGAAALNVVMGFRSLGGICFATAVYLATAALSNSNRRQTRAQRGKILVLAAAMCLTGIAAGWLYRHEARSGLLGDHARHKYETQSSGEFGAFLGGRSELVISSKAILDSPFLGHGSWAKDANYVAEYKSRLASYGYHVYISEGDKLIPTHSHLFGAWVEAGIVGVLFWVWILRLMLRCLGSLHSAGGKMTALMTFCAFTIGWDILFSPYAAERRFITPFYVIVLITYLEELGRVRLRQVTGIFLARALSPATGRSVRPDTAR